MKNHATSELHKKNVKAALGQLTVEGAVGNEQRQEKENSDRMVSAAELRLAAWVAAEDIPLTKIDTLFPF